MLRLTGGILIAAGCLGMGFWYRAQLYGRIEALENLLKILTLLESEICYKRGALPEGCGRIAKDFSEPWRGALEMIEKYMQENQGETFGFVFRIIMSDVLESFPLKKEDKSLFFQFLSENGYADSLIQLQMITGCREKMEAVTKRLRTESSEKGRMAIEMGAVIGLFLILVLL